VSGSGVEFSSAMEGDRPSQVDLTLHYGDEPRPGYTILDLGLIEHLTPPSN